MRVLHGRASDLLGGDRSANRHLYAVFNNARPSAGKAFDAFRSRQRLAAPPGKNAIHPSRAAFGNARSPAGKAFDAFRSRQRLAAPPGKNAIHPPHAAFGNARPPAGKAFDASRVARGLPRRPEKTLSTLLTQLSATRVHLPEKRLTLPQPPEAYRAAQKKRYPPSSRSFRQHAPTCRKRV